MITAAVWVLVWVALAPPSVLEMTKLQYADLITKMLSKAIK